MGPTKQKRPTRKRMLCSQCSVLGENTDAYCPLASYIHGTRQARLVHFKQQKFTSLDLRSRNAQREKECYVRSFQCWARTQTRTAHQLATSTERGKLDWCTSNNKNLHPLTYEAETPNAKKNVMFVVFSAGREHRRVLPISQLHPRNAASQTGALQTTKIYLLGLTKQKRQTRKSMLQVQCFQWWRRTQTRTAHWSSYMSRNQTGALQTTKIYDLRSRNAQREKECYVRSFQCWARTTDSYCSISQLHVTERGKLYWCTSNVMEFTSLDLRSRYAQCHGMLPLCFHGGRNSDAYCPLATYIHGTRTHVMELPLSARLMPTRNYAPSIQAILMSWKLPLSAIRHGVPLISNTSHGTTSITRQLMSWNYLYQQYSCHGTTLLVNTHAIGT